MNDLISRQDVLHELDLCDYELKDWQKWKLKMMVRDIPLAQLEQRWIPCSERLPEEWRDVLLSFDKSITEWTNVGYMFRDEETFEYWFQSDGMSYKKDDVLAWMPLPDAYEEDK